MMGIKEICQVMNARVNTMVSQSFVFLMDQQLITEQEVLRKKAEFMDRIELFPEDLYLLSFPVKGSESEKKYLNDFLIESLDKFLTWGAECLKRDAERYFLEKNECFAMCCELYGLLKGLVVSAKSMNESQKMVRRKGGETKAVNNGDHKKTFLLEYSALRDKNQSHSRFSLIEAVFEKLDWDKGTKQAQIWAKEFDDDFKEKKILLEEFKKFPFLWKERVWRDKEDAIRQIRYGLKLKNSEHTLKGWLEDSESGS